MRKPSLHWSPIMFELRLAVVVLIASTIGGGAGGLLVGGIIALIS